MKAFENLIVRRKLASFRSVFPHDDPTKIKNIEGIYDDILEFSRLVSRRTLFVEACTDRASYRPGLYSESVTRAAWKLLLLQIGSGPTSSLVQALAKRPPVEARVFLSTLMTKCMSNVDELLVQIRILFAAITNLNDRNKSTYRKEGAVMISSSKEMQLLPPMLSFIAWIATQIDWAGQAVLDAGILDMLLHIYIVFTTLSDTAPQDVDLKEALRGACRLILVILGQSHQHQKIVFDHPVCILWTGLYSPPPDYAVKAHVQDRCSTWRRVDRLYIMRRAIAIYRCTLWRSKYNANDVCTDIVEFTE